MLRIGQRWQLHPLLRRCAQGPVRNLALQSRAMASLRILHRRRLRYVCAAVPHGHPYIADHVDPESIARTATGRVLYATQAADVVTLPGCWTPSEWRDLRDCLRDPRATVSDHQDAVSGICCVSAPVWLPDGRCAGAVTVSVHADDLPVGLSTLVSHSACRIGGSAAIEGELRCAFLAVLPCVRDGPLGAARCRCMSGGVREVLIRGQRRRLPDTEDFRHYHLREYRKRPGWRSFACTADDERDDGN